MWTDIEVEDINRQTHRCACIRNVDDAGHVPLHRCAGEQEVYLVVVVACTRSAKRALDSVEGGSRRTIASQVLNHPQARLPIRNRRIEVVLLPMLIHAEALEVDVPSGTELRLYRAWDVDSYIQQSADISRSSSRRLLPIARRT